MYRANYRCFVDGQQEKLYFEHLQTLLKSGRQKVVVFSTTINNYENLSTAYESYDIACVFDHDLDKDRFEKISRLCYKYDKKAQSVSKANRHRVYTAYSNICFDLWLILHKENFNKQVYSTDGYVSDVRRIYGLSKDADIKSEENIKKILAKISLDDVKNAIVRAKKIRSKKLLTDKKIIDKTNYSYFDNPDFSIDVFLNDVISDFEKH